MQKSHPRGEELKIDLLENKIPAVYLPGILSGSCQRFTAAEHVYYMYCLSSVAVHNLHNFICVR